jgi:hypothetical protein
MEDVVIEHDEAADRGTFLLLRDGRRVGELTWFESGGATVIDHTWVDPSLRGLSLGRRLVHAAADWARASGRRIVPACSYARAVFADEPALGDLLYQPA